MKEKDEFDNNNLKEIIKQKEKEIFNLEDDLRILNLQTKGDGYLKYELDNWKKKIDLIGINCINNLNQIKQELYLNKCNFNDNVKFLKNSCEFQIKRLTEKCEDIISKQNFKIEQLKKQNEQLKKRLNKVKNIF
jgi:hypothetical protein